MKGCIWEDHWHCKYKQRLQTCETPATIMTEGYNGYDNFNMNINIITGGMITLIKKDNWKSNNTQ